MKEKKSRFNSHAMVFASATSSSRRQVAAVGGAGARIAVLGSVNLDPDVYPTAGPCSNASLQRNMGLCRGLQYIRCTSSAVA